MTGTMFAVGWVAGLVAVSVVVLVVFGGADDPNSTSADSTNWLQVGLGLLFFSMALRQWRKRPRHGEQPEFPKWMQSVDHFTGVRALVLGVALSAINPKNLALTLAASASIAQAGLSAGDDVVAIAIFVVISSVTVVGAVLLYLFGGSRREAARVHPRVHGPAQRGDHDGHPAGARGEAHRRGLGRARLRGPPAADSARR